MLTTPLVLSIMRTRPWELCPATEPMNVVPKAIVRQRIKAVADYRNHALSPVPALLHVSYELDELRAQ